MKSSSLKLFNQYSERGKTETITELVTFSVLINDGNLFN